MFAKILFADYLIRLFVQQKMREEMLKYDNEQRLKSEKSTVDSSELLSDS
jgi:hypothetical protein